MKLQLPIRNFPEENLRYKTKGLEASSPFNVR